ncbi:glycosyltransferase [Terrabacter aeriphilus]|uniref:Glycosyltransferase n=1 Tax=Terrabacter aeriphilus TaxID=515662 RepID=A0ABP9JHB9_9MICO
MITTAPTTAVVTIVHGRHAHLDRQLHGLARQTSPVDLHVVVAMDDPEVRAVVDSTRGARRTTVVDVQRRGPQLPLAAARNRGVEVALEAGADQLVLLDVDCIPSPGLVERYAEGLATQSGPQLLQSDPWTPLVWCGEVAYLPPAPDGRDYLELDLDAMADPHPARPVLRPDEVLPGTDLNLFWSLSFALSARSWAAIGGFDPTYVGYGGEDTDFAQRLRVAGGGLRWIGGARAYHQHHPTSSPPVAHLHDVVENANRFAERWGWWPMAGWLDAFAERGLAQRRPGGAWEVTALADARVARQR